MKNKFRILISLLFFFFTTHSYSNPIDKINFIGLNNAAEESLIALMPFKAGQELTNSLSNEIIESLFKTGLFSDISISKNQNILNITLKENPTIKYFDISLDSGSGFSNWLKREKMLMTTEVLDEVLIENSLSAGNTFTQGDELDDYIEDDLYIKILKHNLTQLNQENFDYVFYIAGVDIHLNDRLGKLKISEDGIRKRDEIVTENFFSKRIPLCGVLGGGYNKDFEKLIRT